MQLFAILDFWLVWLVLYSILVLVLTQDTPIRITTCSCQYKNETYDLSPLAAINNKARFTSNQDKGFLYSYNPCLPFTLPNQTGSMHDNCNEVAICYWSDLDSNQHAAYGYQHLGQIHCVERDGNVAFRYRRKNGTAKMYSYVELICNESQTDLTSAFKLKSGTTVPVFQVVHRSSCPRKYPEPPPVPTTTFLHDYWFWIVVVESITLVVIFAVGTVYRRRIPRPYPVRNNHRRNGDVNDPLIPDLPPPILQENPEHYPEHLIDPPDEFNIVQPPIEEREPEDDRDEPAPSMNERDEQRREQAEQNNEPGLDPQPQDQQQQLGLQIEDPEPELSNSADHQQGVSGSNLPVERDASDEDSFNNNWIIAHGQHSRSQSAMFQPSVGSNLLPVPELEQLLPRNSSSQVPGFQRGQERRT